LTEQARRDKVLKQAVNWVNVTPKEDSSEQLDANETRSGKGRRLGRGVGKGFGFEQRSRPRLRQKERKG
jgi:hypothetical protein